MTFKKKLEWIELDKRALIFPNKIYKYKDLVDNNIKINSNLKIVISTSNILDALKLLINLDGKVKSIILIPPAIEDRIFSQIFITSMADLAFVDRDIKKTNNTLIFNDYHLFITAISDLRSAENFDNDACEWFITTSGTTGTPKLIKHTFSSLTKTTKVDYKKGKDVIWGLLYDYTRFAGLQVLLQSIIGGSTLIIPNFEWDIINKIKFFSKYNVTHLSATPTFWRKFMMHPNLELNRIRNITLGGEIADQKILNLLSKRFTKAKIRHIYASTEAGVAFSVSDTKAGFPLEFLNNGKIKIIDNQLFILNSEINYLKESKNVKSMDQWVASGDFVEIIDDRVFFRGRISGLINIGGDKVLPEKVEQVLTSFKNILSAKVYAKANPIMGQVVIADIILEENQKYLNQNDIIKNIEKKLYTLLPKYMIPATIKVVRTIEENTSGKVKRT